jgi:hypothetical protein
MQLELEKNKMEFEHKLEALRLEYKDKQKETFLDNPNVQAALMNILGMWGNNGVIKTQGNPPINGTEILDDKTRLQEALKRLLKHDNDFINNICKLADLAENNPSTYKMAVNFLNNG